MKSFNELKERNSSIELGDSLLLDETQFIIICELFSIN